ncbi:MAG TPA: hypothetical protein VIO14_04545 [Dehalococcoidia bacterium]
MDGGIARRPSSRPPRLLLWTLLAALLLAAACDVGTSAELTPDGTPFQEPSPVPDAPPRPYLLGFSSVPAERTEAGYRAAFSLAGQYGELVLIPRPLPWDEFRSGGSISGTTRDTTRVETELARQYGLDLMVAVDPLDQADRGRLANLPDRMRGMTFRDEEVRKAFVAYAKYVALNYKPRYLALGVDVDMYYDANPEDFQAFRSVYSEAYDAVKAVAPETQVFVTFQLESLLGLLPWQSRHEPRWDVVQAFLPKLDVLAVSTYPGFVFSTVEQIPEQYYLQLAQHAAGRPVGIVGSGFSSQETGAGINDGSEAQQEAFVRRLFADAERLGAGFVVWFASRDPAYQLERPFDLYASIGLQRSDGTAKPAWQAWLQQVTRPLAPREAGTPAPAATPTAAPASPTPSTGSATPAPATPGQ